LKEEKKTTCLVVDDEPLAIDLLENHIRQTTFLKAVGRCYNAMEAMAFLEKNKVDLIFLDINMPHLTGMQLKSFLPDNQRVIFTTAYSEFAIESYEKNAFDYLLKPISFERFMKSVLRLKEEVENKTVKESVNSQFFIKSGKEIIQLNFDEILYIEGLGDYVNIVTKERKITTYRRMKELEEILPTQFQRVHLSFIINIEKITKIVDNQVVINESKIAVSDKYREEFTKKISGMLL
jgi:two-component system, LytTR family, response regulator